MPLPSRHEPGDIDDTLPRNAQIGHVPELLIVRIVTGLLEHAHEIGCDEVCVESNDLEMKIRYLFTGMSIEEEVLPGFYHKHLREAVAELEAPDRGDAGTREAWGFGVLLYAKSFRATVDEVNELEIRVTFSTIASA